LPSPQMAAPRPLTTGELASMSVTARNQYFGSLPPDQAAQGRSAFDASRMSMNREYMRRTLRHLAIAPQASGGAQTQTFVAGQTLTYIVPSSNNSFLECLRFRVNIALTPATGTAATYQLNAGAPLNTIDSIQIIYNGTQMNVRPYLRKPLAQLGGYLQSQEPQVPIGANFEVDSYIDGYVTTLYPIQAGVANTWNYEFRIPLNALHPQDARGLLPIMAPGTDVLINVNCAQALLGVDPIISPISTTGGTGAAVTNTGTVQVIAEFRDGKTLQGPILQGLDILDMGTVQYVKDQNLNGLVAGIVNRQKIVQVNYLYYVISLVIDGQQSNVFAKTSNITVLELDMDTVGTNKFWAYGIGSNIDVREFWVDLVDKIGQDIDEGVIPWVAAPIQNTSDASNLDGTAFLNTTPSGWTDVHYGIQLTTVGSVAGINPRVETFIVMVNVAGLQAA
jgi:hypothetical protein